MHNGSDLSSARAAMVADLRRRVKDERVLDAMGSVPRELFVLPEFGALAYADRALPIGHGQTISQPLVVALMLGALEVRPDDRVLEVGSGSGYVVALLSKLAREVVGVERLEPLLVRSREAIASLGCENAQLRLAGEQLGCPELAPFDAILVSAGAPHVPRVLLAQLAEGGRLVLPVGDMKEQQLVRARKSAHGVDLERLGPCAFVPLIGEEAWAESRP